MRITQFRNGDLSYLSGELTAPEAGEFFPDAPALGVAGQGRWVVQFRPARLRIASNLPVREVNRVMAAPAG